MASEVVQTEMKLENGWLGWRVEGRIDISSAGLRVLLRLFKKAKREGKEFTVAGAAGMVKKILHDSNMDSFLQMRASLDEL